MPSRNDLVTAMSNSVCFKADELKGGNVVKKGPWVYTIAGGYKNVFLFINKEGQKEAVSAWCANIDQVKERCQRISEFLKNDTSHYFVNFKYLSDALLVAGTFHPVVIMDWIEGKTLKDYVNEKTPSKTVFLDLAAKFLDMVEYLHSKNIAHGDLQHGNIMVRPDGSLVLVDYDSMYVDSLKGFTDVVKGLPGYQHPARQNNRFLSPKLDYFSELVIYLSLLIFAENPGLWRDYAETEDLLFSADDFTDLKHSKLYQQYGNSPNPTIKKLMNQLENELAKTDINELEPLESLLEEKVVARVAVESRNHQDQTLDVDSILRKIETMMAAIESQKKQPEIDVNQIIKKFTIFN